MTLRGATRRPPGRVTLRRTICWSLECLQKIGRRVDRPSARPSCPQTCPAGAGPARSPTMRFMIMHKNDPHTEAGQPPPMELVTKMGAFIGEYAKAGRFIDGAGLSGSKTRTRLVFRDRRCPVKHGPYRREHELPAATLLLKVRTREEAIGWAERYGKILGDGELELGKVNEPWDIGLMPPPENPPLQILQIGRASCRERV